MNDEDVKLKNLYLEEQSKKEQARIEEENKEMRDAELDEEWKKYLQESEVQKMQMIQQLEEAARIRQERGMKRKKGMGKKKK